VAAVASFVGAGAINATPNTGRLTIALKPKRERDADAGAIARGCKQRLAGIPGLSVFMQPVQDIQIGTRISRTQFQYTLIDTDPLELSKLGHVAARPAAHRAGAARCRHDQQDDGSHLHPGRPRCGDAAGGFHAAVQDTLYDAFGQRQSLHHLRQANKYRVDAGRPPVVAGRSPVTDTGSTCPAPTTPQVPLTAFAGIDASPPARRHPAGAVPLRSRFSFTSPRAASLGNAVDAVAAPKRGNQPAATHLRSYSGDAADFHKSLVSEPWLILAAVVW